MTRPRFLAPEVIQTSAMDCGPAALKSLLGGLGLEVSYGRLREACQTDVDGTSIDVVEDVARQLGAEAEQTMLPLDHLTLPESRAFPAILVVRNPDGTTHFVVAWRRVGPFVQVMDPASGRRWLRVRDLLNRTFQHAMPVAAEAWREWAGTPEFVAALRVRLRGIGALRAASPLLERAVTDTTFRSLATLDAATRMTSALAEAGAVTAGREATGLLLATVARVAAELRDGRQETSIPPPFWSAGPLPPSADGQERVLLRGAVLVSAPRLRPAPDGRSAVDDAPVLAPELSAALHERRRHPLAEALQMLREDGLFSPGLLALATLSAAFAAALEALVLRGLVGVASRLGRWDHRVAAMVALGTFFAILLGLELPGVAETMRMGRRLETRLRQAFFAKIPRLTDRYFASRLTSDMTHRAHAIQVVRILPELGFRILRTASDLTVVALGLWWIDPHGWPYLLTAVAACVALPFLALPALNERDARVRAFDGSLMRFFLDALLGLVALRTHGAAGSLRRQHDEMLGEYRRASFGLLSVSTLTEAAIAAVSAIMTVALLVQYLARGGEPAGSLLLVYWALSLQGSGGDLANGIRQYPELRNTIARLLEPLGAIEDPVTGVLSLADPAQPAADARSGGAVAVRFADVTVRAAGKTILEGVELSIPAGSHVAIVGPSGAGKSTLCALLLGWHTAAAGRVEVDGVPLRAGAIDSLRRRTAWVDPAIQLWNRSLLHNVEYGTSDAAQRLSPVLDAADVVRLLQGLPDGMQTHLGDGGALVSGGEGQRVRLARAMLRKDCDLVILDEPFRGLDREKRRELLRRARSHWANATMLCVTHDVGETTEFDRVLVVADGRVAEDGPPARLAADTGSRYRALLDAERSVREGMWRGRPWRHIELRAGVLIETSPEADK